jgi:hypothetical protein
MLEFLPAILRGTNDRGNSILDEGNILEAEMKRHERNYRLLTKIKGCSGKMWVVDPKVKMS